jgi:hypothetical protein
MSPDQQDPAPSGMMRGTVMTPCGEVTAWASVSGEYLHCIGATTPRVLDHVLRGVERLSSAEKDTQDPSLAVRRLAGRRLAELLHASSVDIAIRRCQDIHGWGRPGSISKGNSRRLT